MPTVFGLTPRKWVRVYIMPVLGAENDVEDGGECHFLKNGWCRDEITDLYHKGLRRV